MKSFTWSYSSLSAFEKCPRAWEAKYIHKVKEPESPAMLEGKVKHKLLEDRASGKPLPAEYKDWERFGVGIDLAKANGYHVEVEQKWGLNRELQPTGWFDRDVWCRLVLDIAMIGRVIAKVVDWKFGSPRYVDETQLDLFAGGTFAHYPHLTEVRASFVFPKQRVQPDGKKYLKENVQQEVWQPLLPRVARMEQLVADGVFDPTPSWMCNGCVVTECQHWKEKR